MDVIPSLSLKNGRLLLFFCWLFEELEIYSLKVFQRKSSSASCSHPSPPWSFFVRIIFPSTKVEKLGISPRNKWGRSLPFIVSDRQTESSEYRLDNILYFFFFFFSYHHLLLSLSLFLRSLLDKITRHPP